MFNQDASAGAIRFGDLVSIVVPVYNRAHLITRSVGSLLHQSYPEIEVVLVDDGSQDDIEEVVAALKDPRIRLIRHERNAGVSAARNTGVREARGALIAFHDSDDICMFDRIEQQVRHFESLSSDHVAVYCCRLFYSDVVDETEYAHFRTHVRPFSWERRVSGDLAEVTVRDNLVNLPTLLVKRGAAEAAGLFDERLRNNEDWDFALRLTRLGPVGFVPVPLYLTPTAAVRRPGGDRISRASRHSTRSYVRITGKLRRDARTSPKDLARHEEDTSGFLLREGRGRAARRYARAAIAHGGVTRRRLALLAFSYVPRLFNAVRTYRRRRRSSAGLPAMYRARP